MKSERLPVVPDGGCGVRPEGYTCLRGRSAAGRMAAVAVPEFMPWSLTFDAVLAAAATSQSASDEPRPRSLAVLRASRGDRVARIVPE
jgi:hypothetical protein